MQSTSPLQQAPEPTSIFPVHVEVISRAFTKSGEFVDTPVSSFHQIVVAEMFEPVLDVLFRFCAFDGIEEHVWGLPAFLTEEFEQFLVGIEKGWMLGHHSYLYLCPPNTYIYQVINR